MISLIEMNKIFDKSKKERIFLFVFFKDNFILKVNFAFNLTDILE